MDTVTDLDEIFEMANLNEDRTGIPGWVWISTRQSAHGPRVKYYEKLGPDQPSFSVSISETPKVVANSFPERVVRRLSPSVFDWVRLNRVALLDFWNKGAYWPDDEVTAFKASLQKLET